VRLLGHPPLNGIGEIISVDRVWRLAESFDVADTLRRPRITEHGIDYAIWLGLQLAIW
jgi:hypothetical protein